MNISTKIAVAVFVTSFALDAIAGSEKEFCYDFGGMAEDATYTVGDVIDTDFAVITIKPYGVDGSPVTADARHADRAPSRIAGGTPPELELYLVALTIEPKRTVGRITTQIAQSISSTGGFAESGIAVNNKGLKSMTGFAGMDGKLLGTQAQGMAKISAKLTPLDDSNWHRGTLEVNAVQGSIKRLRLGGHSWRIDNMCFLP